MARPERLALYAPGAVCALGTDPVEISVAVRAGCRRFERDPQFPGRRDGAPITLSRLALIDDTLSPWERIVALGRNAAGQAMGQWAEQQRAKGQAPLPVPVLISMPPARPGLSDETVGIAAGAILSALPLACPARSGYAQHGHDGFLIVLEMARKLLVGGQADCCIVGGVDSAADIDYLHWLEAQNRLKSSRQPFGLMPGEGAAFCAVRLASSLTPGMAATAPLAFVSTLDTRDEPQPWYTGEASMGSGLTRAIGACLPEGQVAEVCYADLNGESWRSTEWDFAYLRNGRAFGHPLDLRHPAESWGDIGAASAALMTVFAMMEFSDEDSDHRTALICASSDTQPSRSACLLAHEPLPQGTLS